MRDQVMTFLGAGHDTTATGVAWTIHMLALHPAMQDRLREEIQAFMPFLFDPNWCFDALEADETDIDGLPYLENVCRESLRYIPPIPMTVREAVKDDVVDGFDIPKGTVVYMFANAINRMEWFWGHNADEFDPDRWELLPETAVTNSYMTFLQGPRGCLGRRFAEVEMKVLVSVMLSQWEFSRADLSEDPEDWKMWRLVLRPRKGVSVIARPVEKDIFYYC
jgi:cytochrome P450